MAWNLSAERGIDTVVSSGIEVVGAGLDSALDYVKENPVECLLMTAAAIGTGGLAPALGRTLLVSAATKGSAGVLAKAALSVATKTQMDRLVVSSLFDPIIGNLGQSAFDNILRTKVEPKTGSVVYCDLAFAVEHSGIYLGHDEIAHLDGSGLIEIVSPRQFLERLGGLNPALSIYVSCNDDSPVGKKKIARRARELLGTRTKYNPIMNNCHQFSSGCITGNFDNADTFLWMLKHTAEKSIQATTWRVWDISDGA